MPQDGEKAPHLSKLISSDQSNIVLGHQDATRQHQSNSFIASLPEVRRCQKCGKGFSFSCKRYRVQSVDWQGFTVQYYNDSGLGVVIAFLWNSNLYSTDSDYENANRSADVDVELMAFQSIIGDDYKGFDLSVLHKARVHTQKQLFREFQIKQQFSFMLTCISSRSYFRW